MALPHSTGGVARLDTRRGTTGINYASSVFVCISLLVFSVCVNVSLCCVEDFPLSGTPLCRSSPSLMSQHKPVGHTSER